MNQDYRSNKTFWENLDEIIREKGIFVDRPKGSRHPRFPDFIYPYDYGYVKNTASTDDEELDVWIGTAELQKVTGIMNITDMGKRDTEMKILYNCTSDEMEDIYKMNNQLMLSAILLVRQT